MTKEQKFSNALRDVFVGAKVEGQSGYINLMRIKSRYYEQGVFPRLQQDINEALQPFPAFRDELFERLYDFFHRYFSESGSIYFRYTPLHQNVYEKVYTDDKDVMLFWKTHMLYYVKTDCLFKSMEVEVEGQKFFFDVSALEHKKANEKRDIVYSFREKRKDTLVFMVAYSEKGKKTKTDELLKGLHKNGDKIGEDLLERAFRVFEKQSEVDYFINKDAKAFLEEQFNLWLYQYVFSGVSEWTETRIKQLQTLKDIACKIIAFISQFEDELVKIWNKPKFVLNSNYVITLDRIAEKDGGLVVVENLLAHSNFKAQIEEWQQLGIVDGAFKKADVLEEDLLGKRLTKQYEHLPLDTRHFKDVELEILGLFDNLDASLDGWLIKSENYQALKTILPKFRDSIKCSYIDPPYNTGTDEFIYRDRYQHSSWLTMMNDRLRLAALLIGKKGALLCSIDDTEVDRLKLILDSIFGPGGLVGTFVWRRRVTSSMARSWVSTDHEYVLAYGYDPSSVDILGVERDISKYNIPDGRGRFYASMPLTVGMNRQQRPNQWYELVNPKTGKGYWPTRNRVWLYYPPTMGKKIAEDRIIWPEDHPDRNMTTPRLKVYPEDAKRGRKPLSTWMAEKGRNRNLKYDDSDLKVLEVAKNEEGTRVLKSFFGEFGAIFPKPVSLVSALGEQFLSNDELIVDFFAGSGTTAHAVINLNRADGGKRKYILVEMADHFDTVLLPRIKKVVFSDRWKDGRAREGGTGIGQFCKYYRLEQYEDALRRVKYADADLFDDPNRDPYHQYVFLRDLKMLEALEVDTERNKVKVDLSKLYDGIDIAETLSNLSGKWIKRITADPGNLLRARSVEFVDGEVVDLKNLDWNRIKPLIWW